MRIDFPRCLCQHMRSRAPKVSLIGENEAQMNGSIDCMRRDEVRISKCCECVVCVCARPKRVLIKRRQRHNLGISLQWKNRKIGVVPCSRKRSESRLRGCIAESNGECGRGGSTVKGGLLELIQHSEMDGAESCKINLSCISNLLLLIRNVVSGILLQNALRLILVWLNVTLNRACLWSHVGTAFLTPAICNGGETRVDLLRCVYLLSGYFYHVITLLRIAQTI